MSNEHQSIFWGQNTQSGGGVCALIWTFMGNLGPVETDVNACREPSTPVDAVLLLVKTEGGRERGPKKGALGKLKELTSTRRCRYIYKIRFSKKGNMMSSKTKFLVE